MQFSMKEALGMIVALTCTSMVLFSLFNVEYFKGAGNFIESCTQNKVVTIKDPVRSADEEATALNNSEINIVEEDEKVKLREENGTKEGYEEIKEVTDNNDDNDNFE